MTGKRGLVAQEYGFSAFSIGILPTSTIFEAWMRRFTEISIATIVLALLYYSPFWSATLPVFYGEFNNIDGSLQVVRFFDLAISIILFFASAKFLVPEHLDRKTLLWLLLSFLSMLVLASAVEYALDQLTLRVFNLPTRVGEVSDKMLAYPRRETLGLTIIPGNLLLIISGLFYGLLSERVRTIQNRERREREFVEAELKFLRSQINPHFMFNTLNNIYAITQRQGDNESGDAILKLSDLMRYMLYDSETSVVALEQEIKHLQAYIDLMLLKYRNDSRPEIVFDVDIDPGKEIVPLILLPFVENAFKHGVDNKGKGRIHIRLSAEENIRFDVQNSLQISRTPSKEHSGIGLENVRRRLEHGYGPDFKLTVSEENEQFHVNLEIWT